MVYQPYIPGLNNRLRWHGISQRALARAMGRTPTQINRWLNLRASPTLVSVARIEAAIESILQERKRSKLNRRSA